MARASRDRVSPVERAELDSCSFAAAARRIVLERSWRAGVGHIGSALSVVDLLAVLYARLLRGEPGEPDRDRFVLAKGHSALALYAALHLRGWLDENQLESFREDGTLLGVHPEVALTGVDFSTGSLGQGLSLAAGAALAARLQGSGRRAYCLVGDGDCNEGGTWESAMFAAHQRLGNLAVIVDANAQQALGYTADVLDLEPLPARWQAFGWDAREVDGHDHEAILAALDGLEPYGKPRAVIARTTFGHGVSFMARRIEWHYLPLTDEQYAEAMHELDGSSGRG